MATINKITYLDDDYIIVNEDEKYAINSLTREFDSANGTRYIIYNLNVTLRLHTSICDYCDKTFQIPAIIEYTKAIDLIKKLINISVHNLAVDSIPCDKSIGQTYEDIKTSLKNMISLIEIEDPETKNQATKLMQIFSTMCDLLHSEEVENGILSSFPMCYNLSVDLDTTPMGKLLEYLIEYIVAYNMYHPQIMSYHSLNNNIGYIYVVIYILVVNASILPSYLFTKNEDIIMHGFFSMFIDIITDKCGKLLYIEGKNDYASSLLRKYHASYPVLKKITSRQAAKRYGHMLEPLMQDLKKETINMIPYLISYTMTDEERILYLYEYIGQNKKALTSNDGIQTKWFTTSEYLDMLKTVTGSLSANFGRYDMKSLEKILPNILRYIE